MCLDKKDLICKTTYMFVPNDWSVPEGFSTDRMLVRMLKISDLEKDYDPVMSSIDHLQATIPFIG